MHVTAAHDPESIAHAIGAIAETAASLGMPVRAGSTAGAAG
jgi:hypothetical protein